MTIIRSLLAIIAFCLALSYSMPMTPRTAPIFGIVVDEQPLPEIGEDENIQYAEEEEDEELDNTERPRYSGHLIALRPDYTFWNMMNVLRTMFDRPAVKRQGRTVTVPEMRALRRRMANSF